MPFAIFETALGPCGVAWTERGVSHVQLPEATPADTRAKLASKCDGVEAKPSKEARVAIQRITRHLAGEAQTFAEVTLDLAEIPPFYAKVYEVSRTIASGRTLGYGDLAKLAGKPGATRAVGTAMSTNPFPVVVPCHRVLAAGGKMGGFSSYGGTATKEKILAIEGVRVAGRSEPLFEGLDRGLQFDAAKATKKLREADAKLAKIIDLVGPLRLQVAGLQSPFEALAESIVYQQLTGKAAATIFGRVLKLAPHGLTPKAVIKMTEADLRTAGLSGSKTAAMKDLAAKTLSGVVPNLVDLHALGDDAIVERLTEVRGIGRWSVEMLLIFRLGRPDVLPIHDYGVRKGFQHVYRTKELPTPKEVEARGERWRPFRSAASWYLWRASDEARKKTATSKGGKTT